MWMRSRKQKMVEKRVRSKNQTKILDEAENQIDILYVG